VETALEELSAAVLAVTRHRSVHDVLQTIVSTARSLLHAEYAALGVPDDSGGFAEFVVDGVSDEQWAAIGPLPRQHGLLAAMLQEAKPQRLADVRADSRFRWWPAAHPVLVDFLGVPILDGDEILGAIYLANKHPAGDTRDGAAGGFTAADERLLGVLAAHAAIALTNARLYEQTRELTLVEERQRIAGELHDAVAQKLFSARLTADAAAALVGPDPDRARAELAEVARLTAEASTELREIVAALRPAELTEAGLAAALRTRVGLLDRVHPAHLSLDADGVPRLPPAVEETVLRVAEEALHNALRHAAAAAVRVAVRDGPDAVELTVSDDGTGFDAEAPPPRVAARRLGLGSMRDRARAAGGRLTIDSTPGGGTTVRLVVPHG
jgi:signal transduction histidine kinase